MSDKILKLHESEDDNSKHEIELLIKELKICLGSNSKEKLNIILSHLSPSELMTVKKSLTNEELTKMSLSLKDSKDLSKPGDNKDYLLMLKKLSLNDTEEFEGISSILSSFSNEMINDYIKSYPHHSHAVLKSLTKNQLSFFFNERSNDEINEILFDPKQEPSGIKQNLDKYQAASQKSNFELSLLSASGHLNVASEKKIYQRLIKLGKVSTIKDVASNNFPRFLIDRLPKNILREITSSESLDNIISFLNSITDQEHRDYWIDIFAPKGSQKYELIQSEIKDMNPSSTKAQEEFYSRTMLALNNINYSMDKEETLDSWIEENINGV